MTVTKEVDTYSIRIKPPVRPKKRTGDTSLALDTRVMLLSFMSGPDDIPIIADIYERTLKNPDWVVECMTSEDVRDPAVLEEIRFRHNALQPVRGSCLVVMDPRQDETLPEIANAMHPVPVGFDLARLDDALSALV